jgi:hypothetical protein
MLKAGSIVLRYLEKGRSSDARLAIAMDEPEGAFLAQSLASETVNGGFTFRRSA